MNLRFPLFGIIIPVLLAGSLRAQFSDGVPDTAFDGDGIVQTDFGNNLEDQTNAVAVQADGKTVVAGYSLVAGKYQVALARYTVGGALDTTFGTAGRLLRDVGPDHDAANAVAVQPDGKIVIAGYTYGTSAFEFLVMRFTSTGALDTGFGTGGKATLALSPTVNIGTSLALQNDGKIVVAGFASIAGEQDFVVLRYTDEGVLDTTFSGDGIATKNLGGTTEQATSVAVQPDGKIIAAGFSAQGAWTDSAMVRYTAAGVPDAGFGSGGQVISSLSGEDDYAHALALTSTGEILLAGSAAEGNGVTGGVITRYSSSGVLDSGFGIIRSSSLGTNVVLRGLAVQSNGHIIFAGGTSGSGGRYVIGRITSSGSADPVSMFPFAFNWPAIGTAGSAAHGVALHDDGRIAVAGRSMSAAGGADFTVMMLRVPRPDISVALAMDLTDGVGSASLGAAPVGSSGPEFTFTITNPGNAELSDLSVTKSGADADDFTVSALSATSLTPGGGGATFTVTFAPASGGGKTAALQITSNVNGTKNPFDIVLTATALSTAQDTDSDGLNDVTEFRLAALGFDWQVAQTALVETYFATAAGAGLFKPDQVRALKIPTPRFERDPLTGAFTLTFGLEASATLDPPAFGPLPVTAPQVTVREGKLEIRFTGQDDAAFFRLTGE